MLVVIPTFKRLDQLRWSIRSVLRADLPVAEAPRLLVVGNHPESKCAVNLIVDQAIKEEATSRSWDIKVVHRSKTLPAVENWFSAILEHANFDEITFLHGDDDIMLPWGLKIRVEALKASSADIVLTTFVSGVVFSGSEHCYPPPLDVGQNDSHFEELSFSSPLLGNAPFIGNHAYRCGDCFKMAVKALWDFCGRQSWLSLENSLLMSTLYLPIIILYLGGRVMGSRTRCVVRGLDDAELFSAPHGCSNWNNGFMHGAVVDFLSHPPFMELPGLDSLRRQLAHLAAVGYVSVVFDRRISTPEKIAWIRRMSYKCLSFPGALITGLKNETTERTGIRRCRAKQRFKTMKTVETKLWLESLSTSKREEKSCA
jgi:hypothetical protein